MEFDAECVFVDQDLEVATLFVRARSCGDYFCCRDELEQTSLDSTESEPEDELMVFVG